MSPSPCPYTFLPSLVPLPRELIRDCNFDTSTKFAPVHACLRSYTGTSCLDTRIVRRNAHFPAFGKEISPRRKKEREGETIPREHVAYSVLFVMWNNRREQRRPERGEREREREKKKKRAKRSE